MRLSPGCNCCACNLPGCSRSVSTLTLTSNNPGTPSTTISLLNPSTCTWYGCGQWPSGIGHVVTSAADCTVTNASGALSNARVFQFGITGGGATFFTELIAAKGCGSPSDPSIAYSTGTCPDDLTSSTPFGPVAPGVGGGGTHSLTYGQLYTFVRTGGTVGAGLGLLSCNPYHFRTTIIQADGSTEIVDITE